MDLRRPYRPCQPTPAVPFSRDGWFLAAAVACTVILEVLLGVGLVMAFVR